LKINEVEALVGITKKNIRFYEQEGLLAPQRNSENGYRNYSGPEVEILRRIKLLRKLGLPIEEIRRLETGRLTVGDAMARHKVALDRETRNLQHAREICSQLEEENCRLETLDADSVLKKMEELEKEGTTFMNVQRKDVRRKFVAPVIVTILMILMMGGLIGLIVWGLRTDMPPKPILLWTCLYVLVCAAVMVGVIIALKQRIHEIQGGEEDEARKY